jgi:hypothetical protein
MPQVDDAAARLGAKPIAAQAASTMTSSRLKTRPSR